MIEESNGKYNVFVIEDEKEYIKPKTFWNKPSYASSNGTKLLKDLFMNKYRFDFPKSLALVKDFIFIQTDERSIVLDFFAGSGTTAHAVMKLNSEDGGRRKFILVEMADYFDTVIIPRIKKVAYSFEWKDGKPQNSDGNGVFFKYHTLEQYEDSLENIDFEEAKTVSMNLDSQSKLLRESLLNLPFNELIRYKLSEQENKLLNIEKFEKPYSYKLKILDTKNTQKSDEKTVDLIETFIYLSGLKTRRIFRKGEYTVLVGTIENSKTLVIFREKNRKSPEEVEEDIKQFIEEYSPDQLYVNLLNETPILSEGIEVKSIENLFIEKMN